MKIVNAVELHLCNNKPEEIEVEISVDIGGKVEEAGSDGKIRHNTINRVVDHHSTVSWELKLKPGEIFTPEIIYHYFARY